MFRNGCTLVAILVLTALGLIAHPARTQQEEKKVETKEKKEKKAKPAEPVWTSADDPLLPEDFKVQGEYTGSIVGGAKLGCQIIALGKGKLQAVVLPGGLPGDGWDGKNKILMQGELDSSGARFKPADGKRKYLAGPPDEFSATSKYPPPGQKPYEGTVAGGTFTGKTDEGKAFILKKVTRTSPTLGAKAPAGALILFDGTDTKEWKGGRLDKATGLLNTDGKDITSERKFQNYTVHAEFMLPFRPDARGQGRGNSGFYMVHHYEVQILDSFGLDGKNNETSGIYSKIDPRLNTCYPPLTWQTYDIDFTNAVQKDGAKVKDARITVRLNGVVVHDDVEIPGPTGGHRDAKLEGTPGPLILQGHGNPLQFKNIWIAERP